MQTTKSNENTTPLSFKATLTEIGSLIILRLPIEVSSKLPSRGMVMVKGTINNHPVQVALEPDGEGSHWFSVNKIIRDAIGADIGDTVSLEIEPTKEWPEPEIPADLKDALEATAQAQSSWMDITPMARWDWIRWINSTKNPETRKKRIMVMISKFQAGKRRPCCFNRSECTVPDVSKNGVLLGPV